MNKSVRVLALSLAALLLLSSAQAAAAKQPASRVEQTAKPIWTLAMNGPQVAYSSGGRIYSWNVATGASSVVKGEYSNGAHTANAAEIAIAGKRIAWIKRTQQGNTEQPQRLYTATIGGSAHRLRAVLGYTNTDCGSGGPQISGLLGFGNLLVVSMWRWTYDGTTASRRRLDLITPTGLRTIATGPNAVESAAADGSHIAVVPLATGVMGPDYCEVTPSTTVGIYSTNGTLLRQISTGPRGEIALSGKRLVAETSSGAPGLAVYNWTTGALVHTWPVVGAATNAGPHQPAHVQVSGRLALYSVYTGYVGSAEKLHLLDLTTGKDVQIATVKGYGDLRAWEVGPRGLVYVVNYGWDKAAGGPAHGKLVFVPTAKLLAAAG